MDTSFSEESANLIGLEGVVEGSADLHSVFGRESASLIGLAGVAKVTCNELEARYEEI